MLSLGLLKDKVAIVTGASQGLGEQFAKVMAKNGAKVAILQDSVKNSRR